jgi:pimeloyl-ACP methyl ester carboxylesterase
LLTFGIKNTGMNKFCLFLILLITSTLRLMSNENGSISSVGDLFVAESGTENARAILFLHGSGANSSMWKEHFNQLSGRFHCIAPDLPGHGKSNKVEWTSLDEVADAVASIIRAKGKGPMHVVGLSLGGSLIYRLLEKYPELIDRALIDGASAVPIKGSGGIIFGVTMVSPFLHWDPVIKVMAKSLDVSQEEMPNFRQDMKTVSRRSFRKAMTQANRSRLDMENCRIQNPTFFVSGGNESATMHDSHKALSGKIPGSGFAWYPGKGHAWLVSDSKSHIELIRYWLMNEPFPQKLALNPH